MRRPATAPDIRVNRLHPHDEDSVLAKHVAFAERYPILRHRQRTFLKFCRLSHFTVSPSVSSRKQPDDNKTLWWQPESLCSASPESAAARVPICFFFFYDSGQNTSPSPVGACAFSAPGVLRPSSRWLRSESAWRGWAWSKHPYLKGRRRPRHQLGCSGAAPRRPRLRRGLHRRSWRLAPTGIAARLRSSTAG